MTATEVDSLKAQVIEALRSCYDPEIPVNIYDLGLIYGIDVNPEGYVHIKMTLTAPSCPVAGSLPPYIEQKLRLIPNVTDVNVELVWDPPWDRSKMSDAAKVALGFDIGPTDTVPLSRFGR